VPNKISDLHSDEVTDLFIEEMKNLENFQGKHPSIISCEEIYTRIQNVDGIENLKIVMVFQPAEKSAWDIYRDKNTKMSDEEVLDMLE
jgi:hypothetical protein